MNGAEALIKTLDAHGVNVCFANPGTSEMQLVAAIDQEKDMRAVLCLFEGVVTGAADGYARMADAPAATLLHCGPGLANGLANLHNAKRGYTPVLNIVGDHAVDHLHHDAPLTSDVVGVATPMSDWVYTSTSPSDLARAGAKAFQQAMTYPGKVATIIAPADHAWTDGAKPAQTLSPPAPPTVSQTLIEDAAKALGADGRTALYLGGRALRADALEQAGRIAAACGARLICETFPNRLERGAGRVVVERLPYFGEMAANFIKDETAIVFIGAKPPVSFFAYPGKPSWLSPENANLIELASVREDALDALTRLANALNAPNTPAHIQPSFVPPIQDGPLDPAKFAAVIANTMPDDCIVLDEAATAGLAIFPMTAGCAPHDWITLTGGSIGFGLPAAMGASIACPDRKVLALQADGSAMYTVQALWSMARENVNVTTVILNNGSYAILNIELLRVGVENPGPTARALLDLTNPVIDWVSIAEGMGIPSLKVTTSAALKAALEDALPHKGPRLIEAIVDKGF